MKYVTLKEFMEMPEGTLYMLEEEDSMGLYGFQRPVYIKDENCYPNDWFQRDLIDLGDTREMHGKVDSAHNGGDAPINFPIGGRYGLYPTEDEIRFWILTEEDHELLISVLQDALQKRRHPSGNLIGSDDRDKES